MTYDPYEGVYQYIDEQIAFKQQTTGHRAKQPLPRRDIVASAREQAEREAGARNQYRNTRLPPEGLPKVRQREAIREDEELYEDEELSTQRPPRSAVRYQPEETYRYGNTQVNKYTSPPPARPRTPIPPRRSQQPPAQQYQHERYIESIDEGRDHPRGYRRRVRLPWYALLAIGAVLALTVWISGAWANQWWTATQNDWTYSQAFRTFSIDAVVGHNHDSASHPSHFIVQNDKRHIIIVELPADDWSKAIIYSAPTLIGDGQEKTPATISFQANPQTGRLDMVLHVENQTYLFPNNGTKFVTPQGQ